MIAMTNQLHGRKPTYLMEATSAPRRGVARLVVRALSACSGDCEGSPNRTTVSTINLIVGQNRVSVENP